LECWAILSFQRVGTAGGTSTTVCACNSCLGLQLRQIQTGLENRSALTGTQGSHPCLSASVTIRGKLNGTNPGTSAPLTAPFFERFWRSTGWGNRCLVGPAGVVGFFWDFCGSLSNWL